MHGWAQQPPLVHVIGLWLDDHPLIPELKAARKTLEIKSYRGEPHSFAFYSTAARTPRLAVAAQVFEDINAWLRQKLRTPAMPIDPRFVKRVPF